MAQIDKQTPDETEEAGGDEAQPKLNLEIKVDSPSACERHVTVTVPREDIDRYIDKAFGELVGKAQVPGFRAGRAPRKLVETRFRKDVAEQVKGSLLVDSMTQVTEDAKFSAISEPDFDPKAVEVPDSGPMTFEFDIEVRPDFQLPEWKGLLVQRPVREFSEHDVDRRLETILSQHGRLIPKDGPAAAGDYISCDLTFLDGETTISSSKEEVIRIRPTLSFRDGNIEKFDKLMKGVKAGDTVRGEAKVTKDAPNPDLRGKSITAVFDVLEVKRLELPELTPKFLDEMGGFESVEALRAAVGTNLERQMEYEQRQQARKQVTAALTESANWALPPEMLKRQSRRELERAVLELQRNGFSDAEIQAHENELRQNSMVSTAKALKEHFILERIAEDEKMEVDEDDYRDEIALIARQSGESARRVRARLEKQGLMDSLRNQIIERKVVDLVLSHARFVDVPFKIEGVDTEAIDQAVGGEDEESAIPEALEPNPPESIRKAEGHE